MLIHGETKENFKNQLMYIDFEYIQKLNKKDLSNILNTILGFNFGENMLKSDIILQIDVSIEMERKKHKVVNILDPKILKFGGVEWLGELEKIYQLCNNNKILLVIPNQHQLLQFFDIGSEGDEEKIYSNQCELTADFNQFVKEVYEDENDYDGDKKKFIVDGLYRIEEKLKSVEQTNQHPKLEDDKSDGPEKMEILQLMIDEFRDKEAIKLNKDEQLVLEEFLAEKHQQWKNNELLPEEREYLQKILSKSDNLQKIGKSQKC